MFSHAGTIQPKSPILPASPAISSSQIITNPHFKTHLTNANTALIAQTPGLITNQQPILGSFSPQILTGNWVTATPQSTLVAQNSPIFIRTPGQHGEHMFIQTSSTPQIQTVSMATHQINQIAPPTSVQVAPSQVTLTNTSHQQQIQNSCNTNSVVNVSSAVTSVQQSQVASTPSNRPRPLRPANSISSVATQTIPGPNQQKQSDSSSTTQKTIQSSGTAKTKLNQSTAKSSSSVQTSTKSTGATQTTQTSANQQQQTNSNKSDAGNQTHKVSVGTETMSSTKIINKSINETTTKSASKSQSTEAIRKNTPEVIRKNTPEAITKNKPEETVKPVKRTVEKKDASTEQDKEMLDNYYAQKLQQQKQNAASSMQLNNVNSHQNGQILTEANRHEVTTKQPQKAIVKPQILTHVIDGYVIQESPDPFPVNGLSFSFEKEKEDSHMKNEIVNNQKGHSKNKNENIITKTPKSRNDYSICENCGKKKPKNKMKGKSKRFCANCSNQFKEKEKDKNMMKVNNLLFTNSYSPNDTSSTDMEIDIPEIPIDNANKQNEDKKRKATKRTIDSRNDNVILYF